MINIIRYRKKVILDNLRHSFPDKNEAEIQALCNQFYRHLSDIILETIKGITISEKKLRERMIFLNPELLNQVTAKGGNLLLCGGHYNNWEWATFAAGLHLVPHVVGIYKTLSNKYINDYYMRQRTRFGTDLLEMRGVLQTIEATPNQATMYVFINDQAPFKKNLAHYVQFLHRQTAFISGLDKIAHLTKLPIYFYHIKYIRRGYYEATFSLLCEDPAAMAPEEITQRYAATLERDILQAPQHWLWSHKRWKELK